jgi:hypothetical protein
MKTIHLSNRFLEFLLYLLLILAVLLFSANRLNAQLKESLTALVTEAEAFDLQKKGGVYVGQSEDQTYMGWWVQYRKVMRIERVSYDPNTGQSMYHVFYSQVVPLEYDNGHDPNMINNGWLWLPYGSKPAWELGQSGRVFRWVLKPGYPKMNPDNRQLQKVTRNGKGMEVTNIYSNGLTHRTYDYLDDGNLEYDWLFTVRWSQLPPHELVPGQEFVVQLSADVSGGALNYHIGVSPYIDFGGFHATYDPPVTNYNNAIFVGRSGSTGIITYQAQRTFTFRVPDRPLDQIHMTYILGGWGGAISYVWEKQPVW